MKSIIAILAFTILGSFPIIAQETPTDAENCKDSPLFNRMPKYYIAECSKNYNQLQVPMGMKDGETQFETKEGTLTMINYLYVTQYSPDHPSFFQIQKNYENAILKVGGKKIMYSEEAGLASYHSKSGDKEIWMVLTKGNDGDYKIEILEMEAMKQEISASDMLTALNATGSIALYINFETGKSDIKTESQKVIDEMAEMLKTNSSLKVSIEGHTDNVGTPAANKTLSESRAKAVVNSLIAKGIDKTRLSSKGWGQEKPIADNKTEDGKAKNRRVEMVKM